MIPEQLIILHGLNEENGVSQIGLEWQTLVEVLLYQWPHNRASFGRRRLLDNFLSSSSASTFASSNHFFFRLLEYLGYFHFLLLLSFLTFSCFLGLSLKFRDLLENEFLPSVESDCDIPQIFNRLQHLFSKISYVLKLPL